MRKIQAALEKAKEGIDAVCEVEVLINATADGIFDMFQNKYQDRIAVFHFAGHADQYQFLLEDFYGQNAPANAEGLKSFLANQSSLKLVFLNGCTTLQHAKDLTKLRVPAVIGTSRSILDKDACIIADRFYRGLGAGMSIERAWEDAKSRLSLEDNKSENFTRGKSFKLDDISKEIPWELYTRVGDEKIKEWSLPDAANNPIFGLPELNKKYYVSLPNSPYIGLQRFEQIHAGVFFGRNSEIRKLIDKLDLIYPIILYYGQSGVGKSSLLEAGFIPRIENSHHVKIIRRRKELGLLGTLKEGLVDLNKTISKNIQGEISNIIQLWQRAQEQINKPLIFILDQVEESLTKPLNNEHKEWMMFCKEIKELADYLFDLGSGKLILSFRAEYLSQIQNTLQEASIPKTDILLSPLSKTGIIQAIEGVTTNKLTRDQYKLSAKSIEEGLANDIASDLLKDENSPIAPTLQILLGKLWAHSKLENKSEPILSKRNYKIIRKKGLALEDFVLGQFQILHSEDSDKLSPFFDQKVEQSGLVLDLLSQFVTSKITSNTHGQKFILDQYAHRQNIIARLVKRLVDLRLLSTSLIHGTVRIGLAHDTLAPEIFKLFNESNRLGQQSRRILSSKNISHEDNGMNYLDEIDLSLVNAGKSGMAQWSDNEKELVKRSKAIQYLLAETTKSLNNNDIEKALNLAIELNKKIKTRVSCELLNRVTEKFTKFFILEWKPHNEIILSVVYSPDGKFFITGGGDNLAILWSKQREPIYLKGHDQSINSIAISADSKYVLTGSFDGFAKLWSKDGKEVRSYKGHHNGVKSVAFSPDGRQILTGGGWDGMVKLWTLEGQELQFFQVHEIGVTSITFSPDGRYILTGDWDGVVKLWTPDGQEIRSFKSHEKGIYSVAFSPDGKYILTGSADYTAILWSTEGSEINSYEGHDGFIESVAFSPDGKYILTGSDDGSAKLWTIEGQAIQTFRDPFHYAVRSTAFSPDGKRILIGYENGMARICIRWDWIQDKGLIPSLSDEEKVHFE